MSITWSKTPVEIIKDLIASKNPAYDTLRDQFTLSTVAASTLAGHDAAVTLSPVDTIKYKGEQTYNYIRKDLTAYVSGVLNLPAPTFSWVGTPELTDASTEADVLAVVNSLLGTSLSTDDVAITFSTVTPGSVYSIVLVASATNYAFSGTVTLTVTQSVTVESVAPDTDLGSL